MHCGFCLSKEAKKTLSQQEARILAFFEESVADEALKCPLTYAWIFDPVQNPSNPAEIYERSSDLKPQSPVTRLPMTNPARWQPHLPTAVCNGGLSVRKARVARGVLVQRETLQKSCWIRPLLGLSDFPRKFFEKRERVLFSVAFAGVLVFDPQRMNAGYAQDGCAWSSLFYRFRPLSKLRFCRFSGSFEPNFQSKIGQN